MQRTDPAWIGLKQREKLLLKKYAEAWNTELPAWARHRAPTFYRGFPEICCQIDDWLRGARNLVELFPLFRVNMKVTSKTLARLVASPNVANLTGLHLWHCGLGSDAARAIAASPHLAGLTRLVIGENRVAAEGIAALAESSHLMSLVQLNLRSNHFGPDGGNAIVPVEVVKQ
jgi:hypothetical protein